MMTQITPHIFICELCDLLYNPIEDLKKLGITSVISILAKDNERLQKKFREAWYRSIRIRRHFVEVSSMGGRELMSQLHLAYCELNSIFFANYQEKVLVHCVAGMDRSPFVVAKYLAKEKSVYENGEFYSTRTMEEAYAFIKKKRPQIIEHLEWVWK